MRLRLDQGLALGDNARGAGMVDEDMTVDDYFEMRRHEAVGILGLGANVSRFTNVRSQNQVSALCHPPIREPNWPY